MGNFFGPMLADDSIREGIEGQIREWLRDRSITDIAIMRDGIGTTFLTANEIPPVVIAFAAATFGFSVPGYELPDVLMPR